jgi:uncharacterized phage-associated protein
MNMAQVIDVARYIVFLSYTDKEPEAVSNLKLQKLLYYAQALSLAKRNTPLFDDEIQAWTYGPVVKSVYNEYKEHDADSIPDSLQKIDLPSIDDRVFIRQIWRVYGHRTATQLVEDTHAESPWLEARGELQPNDRSEKEITQESMRRYFINKRIDLPEIPRPCKLRKGREVYRIEDAGKVLPAGIWG